MTVTGMNEVHGDSRDVLATILADNFARKAGAAVLKTSSAADMRLKRAVIEEVEVLGTQYESDDPVGIFLITVRIPAEKYELNRAVYKVYICGGKRATGDNAYFDRKYYAA
jgi:hypothetical protein